MGAGSRDRSAAQRRKRRPVRLIAAAWRARDGGVGLLAAVLLPAVVIVALGAIQLQAVYSVKRQTQDIADSAALWGAQQLLIAPVGATDRAQSWAKAQLQGLAAQSAVTIAATQASPGAMTVEIDTNTPSFFANLFPPGGFNTRAVATAEAASQTPLCVVVTGSSGGKDVHLTGQSQMQSSCLVHSNSDITVDGKAGLTAASTEAVTTASGAITPAAETGAPPRSDPFTTLSLTPPTPCTGPKPLPTLVVLRMSLPPGTYCGDININVLGTLTLSGGTYVFGGNVNVAAGGTLQLSSGQYYIDGSLQVTGTGAVTGTDAVLIFTNGATMNLSGQASLNLAGRQSGALAGFVIIADRTYAGSFQIQSDFINKLTGVVYVPTAALQVQGTKTGIQASDWTVIDAQSLQLTGSPDLVINSAYSGSSVPVPAGVGDNLGVVHLTQ